MSDLARYLAGDNYLTRSASGLKRGLSALADSLVARSNEGTENMQAALSGVRVKPGAILTDAGYVMPDASGQPDFSQIGLEREPDTLRLLELFGNIMGPVKGATVAAKSGMGGKVAAGVARALPMDETSRMARAAEMGFNIDAYHGTAPLSATPGNKARTNDILSFSADVEKNSASPQGTHWFSSSPENAGTYAEAEGGVIYPAKIQMHNPMEIDANGNLWRHLNGPPTRTNPNWSGFNDAYASIMGQLLSIPQKELKKTYGKGARPEDVATGLAKRAVAEKNGVPIDDMGPIVVETGNPPFDINEAARRAIELGHDGLIVRNVVDAGNNSGAPQTSYAVFEPSQVRSRFAAFDPAKADSADLLASRANLGPIVNALLQGYGR